MFQRDEHHRQVSRSRWAAVGAAVAVCLGAGGLGVVNAAIDKDDAAVFKPITPCRMADTRPGIDNVGPRSTPITGTEEYTLNAWGAIGDCTAADLPDGITALSLNVTALNPTTNSFVALYPGGVVRPQISNLNPGPAVTRPLPNAVTVDLNAVGDFTVYNHAGTVDVIIDVVGVYDDEVLDGAVTSDDGKTAYAWACSDVLNALLGVGVDVTANCGYSYNPSGSPVTIVHNAVGDFTVNFPGLNMSQGHVQVTAYGGGSDYCKVRSWGNSNVRVSCYTNAGAASDSRFNVMTLD